MAQSIDIPKKAAQLEPSPHLLDHLANNDGIDASQQTYFPGKDRLQLRSGIPKLSVFCQHLIQQQRRGGAQCINEFTHGVLCRGGLDAHGLSGLDQQVGVYLRQPLATQDWPGQLSAVGPAILVAGFGAVHSGT